MRSRLAIIVLGIILGGCRGAFGDAADYFTGPVSGVGLKPSTSIASGATERLSAVVVPAKTDNKKVVWSCMPDDGSVVTVDQNGLVTAVAVVAHGETKNATIAVTTEEGGYTANCVVTVVEKPVAVTGVSLNTSNSYLVVNDPGVEQLNATVYPADATDQTITWTSDAPAIVSVDAAGLVTAKQAGTGTITARSANGISASCSFTVLSEPVAVTGMRLNKTASVIAVGGTETFFPILAPYNATNRNVHWSSSDPAIATVNALGTVCGIAASAVPVIITAKTTDGSNIAASVPVTIGASVVRVQGVSLDRAMATITVGRQQQFSARVAPSNATDQNLVWKSSNPSVAVVDAGGVVMALAEGVATITVSTTDGGFSRSCIVNATTLPTYTVSYAANGGSGSAPVDANAYLPGSVAVALGNTFANGSFIFTGWKDAQGRAYQPGSVFEIGNADVTLSAQWALSATGYTVSYSANGGTGTLPAGPSVYAAGATVTVLGNPGFLAKTGFAFGGWHNGSDTLQPGATFVMGSADVVLSAVWVPTYSVTYVANTPGGAVVFGSVPVDAARYTAGASVPVMGNLNNLFAYNWTLSGWSTMANGAGNFYPFGARFTMGSGNVTLYGVWNETTAWRLAGNAGFSTGRADCTHIEIDSSGTPYVAYVDFGNGEKATVMKYNGSSWMPVGTPGFSAGRVSEMDFAIASSGVLYVVYRDWVNGSKATVMKYNGSSWVVVGATGFSADVAWCCAIAISAAGVPYVTYQDCGNANKATVKKFNGTAWENVGSPGFSASAVDYTDIAISSAGIPYVVYRDTGNGSKATAMKFNGTVWLPVGTAGFSASGAEYTQITFDASDIPYVVYSDANSSGKATLMKYSGSSWVPIGAAGFSAGTVLCPSLVINSFGVPYVAYYDGVNGGKATVTKYSGDRWVIVGNAGFSAGQTYFTDIAIGQADQPYVVYSDSACSSKATVMKYQ